MFSLSKFLGGFNIFNGEKLAKIFFYAILIAVGIGIYHNAFKPKTVTNQKADNIINVSHNYPKVMFGCANWKIPKEAK